MEFIKFSQILDFQQKSHIKAGDGLAEGACPFFTSSPILSKYYNTSQFDSNSLIFGTGGSASVHMCEKPFSVSTDCLVAQLKSSASQQFEIKFVYYYLSGNIWVLEKGFKGAGLKHISKGYINNIDIPELPIEDQKRIVKLLDKAQEICQKRKKVIGLLDDYLKSVFLEMFGDGKNFETIKLELLAKKLKGSMRSGPFGSDLRHSEFVDNGIAVIGIDNAVKNKFEWAQRRYITTEKYQKLKRYTIFPRDVIITIMATIGRSAVIPDDIPVAINTKHLAAITLDQSKANPYFIAYSIHSDQRIKKQITSNSIGAIMPGLNLGIIKNLNIIQFPIELQNEFERFYKKIEVLKEKMLSQLEELETQFQVLVQESFKSNDSMSQEVKITDGSAK
ncbi:MAG: restriction endonuclease subunit S [Candidatus Berkelbacteria bacterium]